MTTSEGTESTDAAPRESVAAAATNRAGLLLAFAGLVVGTLGDRVLTVWHPQPDTDGLFSYALVSGRRDTWWAMHFFGGMGVALESLTLAGLVMVLVRGRGSRWTNPGAALLTLGGLFFAARSATSSGSCLVWPSACSEHCC